MLNINETTIPLDWLVAAYDLDGNANDSSGNWNDWTATNVSWAAAERGYVEEVGSFNGSSSYVEVPHSTDFESDNFSISVWFNSDNFSSWSRRIIWKDAWGNTNWDWQLRMDDTIEMQVVFQAQNWSSEVKLNSWITSADVWSWCNVSVVWISSSITIYVDWIEKNTASFAWSNANNSNTIQLGRHSTSWTNFFDWEIWLVRIYNKALTSSEVNALYLEGLRKLWPTNTRLSWDFPKYSLRSLEKDKVLEISKANSSGTYYDQTGNGNNGTATNVTDSVNGLNNVMSFNGSSSRIEISDTPFDFTWDFSVFSTVKFDNLSSTTKTRFISKRNGWADWWMMLANTNGKFRIDFYANWGQYFTNSTPNTTFNTSWIFNVGFTYNNTTKLLQCYIDWVADWSVTTVWNPTLNNVNLYIWKNNISNFFDWEIINPTIYNRALSETEVKQLYYANKII